MSSPSPNTDKDHRMTSKQRRWVCRATQFIRKKDLNATRIDNTKFDVNSYAKDKVGSLHY